MTASLQAGPEAAPGSLGEASALAAKSQDERSVVPPSLTIRLGGAMIYDDNILLRSTNKESDLILQATAGFTWTPWHSDKRKFAFNYDGTAVFFMDHSEGNGVNHAAGLNGYLDLARTKMALTASYGHLTGSDLEARQFITRDVVDAVFTADYDLSGKWKLNGGAKYFANLYDTLQSSTDLSARLGMGYAISEKTTLGLAGVVGYLDSDLNPRQTYQSVLLTAGYDATGKLKLTADGGIQRRQFEGGDGTGGDTNFVFSVNANYQMREKTSLALTAGRGTVGSAVVSGASIERTSVALTLNQRLGQRFSLSLGGGYDLDSYVETRDTTAINREEDRFFARSALTWALRPSTNIGLFYEFRDVSSNIDVLSYQSNRFGVQLTHAW